MLEYVSYEFEEPKYDVEECIQRDMTYAAPLKVKLRLIVFETDEETGARSVKDIKEQDVYMGDIPLMTDKGTFIVNGTERVIVSQMHRSPGVFFDHDKGKTHASGKLLFAARVIPYRGSWLDFEFDAKDIVYRPHRPPPQAAGHHLPYGAGHGRRGDPHHLLRRRAVREARQPGGWATPYKPERWRGVKPEFPLIDADTGEEVAPAGTKISARNAKKSRRRRPEDPAAGARGADRPVPGPRPGQLRDRRDLRRGRRRAGRRRSLAALEEQGFTTLDVLDIDDVTVGAYIRNTLRVDKNTAREDALFDIYRVMRPGEPPTVEAAEAMFKRCSSTPSATTSPRSAA